MANSRPNHAFFLLETTHLLLSNWHDLSYPCWRPKCSFWKSTEALKQRFLGPSSNNAMTDELEDVVQLRRRWMKSHVWRGYMGYRAQLSCLASEAADALLCTRVLDQKQQQNLQTLRKASNSARPISGPRLHISCIRSNELCTCLMQGASRMTPTMSLRNHPQHHTQSGTSQNKHRVPEPSNPAVVWVTAYVY